MKSYRKPLYVGIIIILIGIVLNNILSANMAPFGTVLIGVGALFFIIGINKKRVFEEQNKKDDENE